MANRNAPTTTVKERNFVSEPMNNKSVTALPGIGDISNTRLNKAGFTKASQVYGQFLVLNRNHVAFENWMKDTCQANRKQARDCSRTLDTYYRQFN